MRIIVSFFLIVILSACSSSQEQYNSSYSLAQHKQDQEREKRQRLQLAVDKKCRAAKVAVTGFTALTVLGNVMGSMLNGGSPISGGIDGAKLANKEVWVQGVKYSCP